MKRIIFYALTILIFTCDTSLAAYQENETQATTKLVVAENMCIKPDRTKLDSLTVNELAALKLLPEPRKLPNIEFIKDGKPSNLQEFRGKSLLLNLWATWCAPCRAEMPALSKLQTSLENTNSQVLAISVDYGDASKPRAFLETTGTKNLGLYTEPNGNLMRTLKTLGRGSGIPTTLLVDSMGCEHGFLLGITDWDSDRTREVLRILSGK